MALARVLCPTLIGRESELSALEDALPAALRGDGGVVIVGGEAGLGKTGLVSELTARANRLRCVVMSGDLQRGRAIASVPAFPYARGTTVERVELRSKGFSEPVIAFRVRASAEAGLRA